MEQVQTGLVAARQNMTFKCHIWIQIVVCQQQITSIQLAYFKLNKYGDIVLSVSQNKNVKSVLSSEPWFVLICLDNFFRCNFDIIRAKHDRKPREAALCLQ